MTDNEVIHPSDSIASIPSGINDSYDPEKWRIDRFTGTPPPMDWLVRDLIPMGIAGTIYSVGGAGKSTLALDLAIRVAIALTFPTMWMGSLPIENCGTVAYFSAEDPEYVLHRRIKGICAAIAEEEVESEEAIFRAALDNLLLANMWGKVEPLFNVGQTVLGSSSEYTKMSNTLQLIKEKNAAGDNPLSLIVIDPRSRFSGAEGAGNALVSREVALYEKLAHDTGATVLLLHHVNKASLYGSHAMAASRGESAFLDSLRFSIHLETLHPETAAKNGISEEERASYLVVTNSKQNYGILKRPMVIHRDGYRFEESFIKAGEGRAEHKARQVQQDREAVMETVRRYPGYSQQEVIRALAKTISQARCRAALATLEQDYLLAVKLGPRGARQYYPAKDGQANEKS